MAISLTLQQVLAEPITPEGFAPFGQVIFPGADGTPFGPQDAQLVLDRGIPRLYLMTLPQRGTRFQAITRHRRCTQCLGALEGKDWLLAVAPPCPVAGPEDATEDCPDPSHIRAFHVPGHCFVNLAVGTWHAGPYFRHAAVSFYNLELSDTNLSDHHTCNLAREFGLEFEILGG